MAKRGQGEGTISKRSDGTYWARITIGKDETGKQKRKAYYGKTRKEVQEKLTASLNEINSNTYIEPTKMTVSQWLNVWLRDYKKNTVKGSTYASHHQMAHKYINPVLGQYKLKDVRKDMVQKFMNSLTDSGYSLGTIIRINSVLHCAFQQAVECEIIAKNVVDKVTKTGVEKKKIRVLTIDEQKRFEEAAKKFRTGNIFIIALYTGLRIGEITALTWDDIDFENQILRVNKTQCTYMDYSGEKGKVVRTIGSPKTRSSNRTVPLVPKVIELFKLMKANNFPYCNYIFTSDNRRINMEEASYMSIATPNLHIKQIAKAAGIEDYNNIHCHCMRHTFATRGLENGIELRVMQELLGHSKISMTADIYTHVLPDKKKESIMKLSNVLPD